MDTQTRITPITEVPEEVLRRFRLIERAIRRGDYGLGRHRDWQGREFFSLALLTPAPSSETNGIGALHVPLAAIMPRSEAKGTVLTGVACITSGRLMRV
jgi:hypothetical protein